MKTEKTEDVADQFIAGPAMFDTRFDIVKSHSNSQRRCFVHCCILQNPF